MYYEKWYMIHFEPICEISNPGAARICVSDDNDLVASVDEFLMAQPLSTALGWTTGGEIQLRVGIYDSRSLLS